MTNGIDTSCDNESIVSLESYNDYRSEVEKPINERAKIVGRDGCESPARKYHLKDEEKMNLVAESAATGGVVNPLKGRVGAYWGSIESLIQLGVMEYHSLK